MTIQRLSSLFFLAGAIGPLVVSVMLGMNPVVVWVIFAVLGVASFRMCFAATRMFPDRWWWWWVPLNIIPVLWGLFGSLIFSDDLRPYALPGGMLLGSILGCVLARRPKGGAPSSEA